MSHFMPSHVAFMYKQSVLCSEVKHKHTLYVKLTSLETCHELMDNRLYLTHFITITHLFIIIYKST